MQLFDFKTSLSKGHFLKLTVESEEDYEFIKSILLSQNIEFKCYSLKNAPLKVVVRNYQSVKKKKPFKGVINKEKAFASFSNENTQFKEILRVNLLLVTSITVEKRRVETSSPSAVDAMGFSIAVKIVF
ncbi:hypothetical protein CEXT_357291 [Caerostris extrusa]|uniref:Uncharacterized protein n=1 Tax=Caerostris extrusa TaxID=172846 RepID=A0AAV4YB72_CAEEX|nr:hypothetical protein CEXT_357291 [Caerostris extrusa]